SREHERPSGAKQFAEKYQLRQQNPLRQQVENPRLEPNLENSLLAPKSPKMSFSANCLAPVTAEKGVRSCNYRITPNCQHPLIRFSMPRIRRQALRTAQYDALRPIRPIASWIGWPINRHHGNSQRCRKMQRPRVATDEEPCTSRQRDQFCERAAHHLRCASTCGLGG